MQYLVDSSQLANATAAINLCGLAFTFGGFETDKVVILLSPPAREDEIALLSLYGDLEDATSELETH